MFEQLPDIYVNSSKIEPAMSVNVSSTDVTNDTITRNEVNKDVRNVMYTMLCTITPRSAVSVDLHHHDGFNRYI